MSGLQLWLIALGALLLAAVAGHGVWQTRRGRARRPRPALPELRLLRRIVRPEAEAPRPVPPRREPGFDAPAAERGPAGPGEPSWDELAGQAAAPLVPPAWGDPADEAAVRAVPDGGTEAIPGVPGAGPVCAPDKAAPAEAAPSGGRESATAAPAPITLPLRRREGPRIDALIDTIATLRPDGPLSGDALMAHLPATRRVGSKLLLVEARPLPPARAVEPGPLIAPAQPAAAAASASAPPAAARAGAPLRAGAVEPAALSAGPRADLPPWEDEGGEPRSDAGADPAPPRPAAPDAADASAPADGEGAPGATPATAPGADPLAGAPVPPATATAPLAAPAVPAPPPAWESPRPGVLYGEIQLAAQLANRSGPLNEIEFSEFAHKVQALAEALQAEVELPDMREAVARARQLDAFASAHDAVLNLSLRARRAAWTPGFVQQQARALGLLPGGLPGRLVLPAREPGAPPPLVLQMDPQAALADEPERAALRELSLSLDVPQTPQAEQPFAAWQALAGELARALEAEVCDDAGQPLGEAAFAAIGQSLDGLYTALAAQDLPAGSAAARRLFA